MQTDPFRPTLRRRMKIVALNLRRPRGERWLCPLCGYHGVFRERVQAGRTRPHAACPRCDALERHRLQRCVLRGLMTRHDLSCMRVLHVAPEPHLGKLLRASAASYETADLAMEGVDHRVDLTRLPFADASYDLVYASHVLEHVADDRRALGEIVRVLAPGGMAVLPVPIVSDHTVEFDAPDPQDSDHVRAPGPDYFDRYREHFARVELFTSEDFSRCFQPFVYSGDRATLDFVPVCHLAP